VLTQPAFRSARVVLVFNTSLTLRSYRDRFIFKISIISMRRSERAAFYFLHEGFSVITLPKMAPNIVQIDMRRLLAAWLRTAHAGAARVATQKQPTVG
jgi:hypothetical protein